MYRKPRQVTMNILNGNTISSTGGDTGTGIIKMANYTSLSLQFPAVFTGATVTFQASPTLGGVYATVKDSDGNDVSIPVTASKTITLSGAEADAIAGCDYLKIVSASGEAADRAIICVIK